MNDVLNEWFGEAVRDEVSYDNVIDIDTFLQNAVLPENKDDPGNASPPNRHVSNNERDNLNDYELLKLFEETDASVMEDIEALSKQDNFELEKLFLETDNDVLIDMECDNLHLCNSCGVRFLLIENLNLHREDCNNKDYRFHCQYCNKKFNRQSYKDLHEKNCDRSSGEHSRPLKQMKIDDYAEPKSPVFPLVIQLGGSVVEHEETWGLPKNIQTALNNKAVTYRKEFDTSNKKDLMGRMVKIISTFRSSIQNELSQRNGIKYYFTLRMIFHQSKDTSILTEPPVTFRSEVFTALNSESLNLHEKVAIQQFNQRIDEFQLNGSGWVIDHFISMDIGKFNFHSDYFLEYKVMSLYGTYIYFFFFRCCSL